MSQIYDPIRKKWVLATPEEKVRQRWILYMTQKMGYPSAQMAIEKKLSSFLKEESLGLELNRRIDLLVYHNKDGDSKPLLIIECKKTSLSEKALYQLHGYNHFIRAPFYAIANDREILLGFLDAATNQVSTLSYLPKYGDLTQTLVC